MTSESVIEQIKAQKVEQMDRGAFEEWWRLEGTFCDNPFTSKKDTALECWKARGRLNEPLVETLKEKVKRLREALIRLRDCDWIVTPLDRMDGVRDIARAALNSTAEAMEKCLWAQDMDDDSWDTECGNKFVFESDTPIENDFHFCPYCGKHLSEKEKTE